MEGYADWSDSLVRLSSELRDLGVADILRLPTIVFIGDQSSGKSSVLQRLSNVVLPRAIGTCTRVPVEVRMKPDSEWKCRILVYTEHGGKPMEFIELATMELRDHTDKFILMAQEAILTGKWEKYKKEADLTKSSMAQYILKKGSQVALGAALASGEWIAEKVGKAVGGLSTQSVDRISINQNRVRFSDKPVIVEVQGPGLSHLSVVDLPGIIQSTENKEDAPDVSLIKNLVLNFSRRENTLLAVTLDISTDIERQEAWKVVKELDPEGNRTVGILTKVDKCENSSLFLEVIQGKKFTVRKGCYAVVNPGVSKENEKAIVMDNASANRNEMDSFNEFFAMRSIDSAAFQDKIGIENLRSFLSMTLSMTLRNQIPRITQEAIGKLKIIDKKLQSRPDITHPLREMDIMVQSLHEMLRAESLAQGESVIRGEIFRPEISMIIRKDTSRLSQDLPGFFSRDDLKLDEEVNNFITLVKSVGQKIKDNPSRQLPREPAHTVLRNIINDVLKPWERIIHESLTLCLDKILARVLFLANLCSQKDRFPDFNQYFLEITQRFFEKRRNEFQTWFSTVMDMSIRGTPVTNNNEYFSEIMDRTMKTITDFVIFRDKKLNSLPTLQKYCIEELVAKDVGAIQLENGSNGGVSSVFTPLGTNILHSIATADAYVKLNRSRLIDWLLMSLEGFFLDASFSNGLREAAIDELGLFARMDDKSSTPTFDLKLRPEEEKENTRLKEQKHSLESTLSKLRAVGTMLRE